MAPSSNRLRTAALACFVLVPTLVYGASPAPLPDLPTPAGDPAVPPAAPPAGPAAAPGPGAGPLLPPPGSPATDPGAPADEIHDLQLRELEEKVVGLKEKVFRAKKNVTLLRERLLNDVIAEAKVVILHTNDMGSSFKPVQVLYHLDGDKIYFADENSKILEKDEIEIFNQTLVPGNHVLTVEMSYRGDSVLFNYLKDYLFKLRASYTFYATKGKVTTVHSIGYQKGDITYDLRDRPSITFEVKQVSYTAEEVSGDGGGAPKPAVEKGDASDKPVDEAPKAEVEPK
jgi:hypothetical protein